MLDLKRKIIILKFLRSSVIAGEKLTPVCRTVDE